MFVILMNTTALLQDMDKNEIHLPLHPFTHLERKKIQNKHKDANVTM